ncbi:hypothetical protein GCM10010191_94800 [Actinomadura vinacea]|uniref:SWIM-type domain-containing protein n=1 Tax=Actinomadura vinacea TaxID=115336 RepID=A0ABN3KH42_9ACTN
MIRTDLLALTPESLAALANRGLVKRATKDLDAGNAPEVSVEDDGSVRGAFPDGVQTTLPGGGGLEGASCTCAATGVCRHQVGLVLAYQRQAPADETPAQESADSREEPADGTPAADEPAFTDWSPGGYDDEALVRVLGERPVTAARRTFRSGYAARVHRPTAADPVASVELPTCTVRFLVPHEFGYVHTDAVATMRGEVVALAVWAFRTADEQGLAGSDVRVDVGGKGTGGAAGGSGLESALGLVDQVLLDGAMHAGPVLGTALHRTSRELTGKNLHWPAAAVDDIAGQLAAYRERGAAHEPERLAALLAEVHARHRAALHDGGTPRSQVLGTNETAETPLRRVRLTALGCRVGGTDEERTADVFLAHAGSGIVLVLKRRWAVTEGQPLTGGELAGRRVSGAPLRALATANVVSENATRSPSRIVRLGTGRVSKTSVTPVGTAWGDLPGTVLARDLLELEREMDALPTRLVRPRVAAEFVRVVEIAEVKEVGYLPGAQRLEAIFRDSAGTVAAVSAAFSPHCPGALDELAGALAGDRGEPLYVSGSVRRSRGMLIVDPVAVMTTEGVVVPDLAAGDGSGALEAYTEQEGDPLSTALAGALDVCADAAHRGLRHVPHGTRARVDRAAGELRATGLGTTADALAALAAALDGDDTERTVAAWVDTQLRLITAMDLR